MTLLEKYIEIEKVRIRIEKAITNAEGNDILICTHEIYDKPTFTVWYHSEAVSEEGSSSGITVEINEGDVGEAVFKIIDDNKFPEAKVKKLLDHAKMVLNKEF